MISICDSCEYDWDDNPLDLHVEIDGNKVAGEEAPGAENLLNIRCPVCGNSYQDGATLSHLGAIRTPMGVYQWTRDERDVPFRLEGDAEQIEFEDTLFDAVPVFDHGDGDPKVPDLPVRAKYLGLVDFDRFRDNIDEWRGHLDRTTGRYVANVPFRNRPGSQDVEQIELPLIGEGGRQTERPAQEAIEGFELTVWPDIQTDIWQQYIVEAMAMGDSKDFWLDEQDVERHIQFGQLQGSDKPQEAEAVDFPGFSDQTRTKRYAELSEGRPDYIELRKVTRRGREWGGVFLPAPSREVDTDGGTPARFGLDFGTSNTCVALEDKAGSGGDEKVHPVTDCYEYLVQGKSAQEQYRSDEYAPRWTTSGFGEIGEFLPTKILSRWPREQCVGSSGEASQVGQWVPGIDYTIPGSDIEWVKDDRPEDFQFAKLKWGDDTEVDDLIKDKMRTELVQAYLKALFVQHIAQHLSQKEREEGVMPSSVSIDYGHPGSWPPSRLSTFEKALDQSLQPPDREGQRDVDSVVEDWVDLSVKSGSPEVESFAALKLGSSNFGTANDQRVDYELQAAVDVGGGSTDIAMLWAPFNRQEPAVLEYMSSVRYAGEHLFDGLYGPEPYDEGKCCFAVGESKSEISRHLRKHGVSDDLIRSRQRAKAERRIKLFYSQMKEYLARMIAATVFNGQFERRNPGHDRLSVALSQLGNGWGFGETIYHNIDRFAEELERRTQSILDEQSELLDREIDVFVSIQSSNLPTDVQPKHAVARGVLRSSDGGQKIHYSEAKLADDERHDSDYDPENRAGNDRRRPWRFRTVLGMPTIMRTSGEEREEIPIQWWYPVEGRGAHYEAAHGPELKRDAGYRWVPSHPEFLDFPRDIEEDRFDHYLKNESEDAMYQTVSDRNQGWFSDSPLKIFLEKGLRERIKEVI